MSFFAGIALQDARKTPNAGLISTNKSPVVVLNIATSAIEIEARRVPSARSVLTLRMQRSVAYMLVSAR